MANATDQLGADPPDSGGRALLVSIARSRLDEQMGQVRALDSKLSATFSLNAATVALFGAALTLSDQMLPNHIWGLALSVLAVFAVNLLVSYRAYQEQDWSLRPDLNDLEAVSRTYPLESVERWVVNEIGVSLRHNEALLHEKARDARRAFGLAVLDAVLVGVTAVTAVAPFA